MIPTEQAARWLADVPRYVSSDRGMQPDPLGAYLHWHDLLPAIARLFAPGDELKLIADCELAAKVMADTGTFETGQSILREAAARLSALTAQVAELEAEVAKVTSDRAYIIGANAGWEAAVEQGEATPAAAAVLARINEAEDRIAAVANAAKAEVATLRDRLARMEGALTLAANRLQRRAVDYIPGGSLFIETSEWAAEARAALTDGGSNG